MGFNVEEKTDNKSHKQRGGKWNHDLQEKHRDRERQTETERDRDTETKRERETDTETDK